MNQRTVSKSKSMDAGDRISVMSLIRFLEAAKDDMTRRGKEDEAFVLEMLEEHFRDNKPLVYGPMVLRL